MFDFERILPLVTPVNNARIFEEEFTWDKEQWGACVKRLGVDHIDAGQTVHLAIVGVPECRGSAWFEKPNRDDLRAIRAELYQYYQWHPQLCIVDLGNAKIGKRLHDTYDTLQQIVDICVRANVLLVVMGGSHDLVLPQYYAMSQKGEHINFCNVDAVIDLNRHKRYPESTYLAQMLSEEPSHIKMYTHLAFQSYYTHPQLLRILDSLNCNCSRLGYVKDKPYEVEPEIRSSHIFAFDICAVSSLVSPVSTLSSNGLSGEEACMLARFAGMSTDVKIIGIYGYHPFVHQHELSAALIAQMIWYVVEGLYFREKENISSLESDQFNIFYTTFNQLNTTFYQSRVTRRWWMRVNDNVVIPCSQNDYKTTTKDEVPDRWLRFHNTP